MGKLVVCNKSNPEFEICSVCDHASPHEPKENCTKWSACEIDDVRVKVRCTKVKDTQVLKEPEVEKKNDGIVELQITGHGNTLLAKYFMQHAINKGPELDDLFGSIWNKDKRKKIINKGIRGFTYSWKNITREQVGFLKGLLMVIPANTYLLIVEIDDEPEIIGELP